VGICLKTTPFSLAINVTSAMFCTRLVLELDGKVTMFKNKENIFVACRQLTLDRKEA